MKNKVWAVLLAALLVLSSLAVPTAAEESWAISDGSFETWGETGEQGEWQIRKSGTAVAEVSTEAAYTGSYGVKLSLTDTDEVSRICLYQNVGAIPTGTSVEVTAMIKIVSLTAENGVRLIARYGSVDGSTLFDSTKTSFTTTTQDWTKHTLSAIVSSEDKLYIDIDVNQSSNFEVYVDDVTIEECEWEPKIKNPNFDSANNGTSYTSWANRLGSGQTASVVYTDPVTESNVVYLTEQGYISQEILVESSTKYRVSFDYKSDGVGATVKLESGTAASTNTLSSTEGTWIRRYIQLDIPADKTALNILLRYVNGSSGTAATYVCFDNITIEKVDTDELLTNGDFEYGNYGWTLEGSSATVAETTDAFSGNKALTVSTASGTNGSILSLNYFPEHDKTIYYELSCYIKVSSGSQVNIGTENHKLKDDGSGNYTGSTTQYGQFKNLVTGKWMKITKIIPVLPEEGRAQLKLRVIGGGTVTFDKASLRPFEKTSMNFSAADGSYTEKITDGGMATIHTPLPSESAKTAIMAIYCNEGNSKKLADVQIVNTTEADAANGYAVLTLTAGTITDFADKDYYAKILLLDGPGTLAPLEDAVTVTKQGGPQ